MSNPIPGGAFPEAAEHETRVIKRPDGKDVTAFKSRAEALKAMRSAVIAHDSAIDELKAFKAVVEARPF